MSGGLPFFSMGVGALFPLGWSFLKRAEDPDGSQSDEKALKAKAEEEDDDDDDFDDDG